METGVTSSSDDGPGGARMTLTNEYSHTSQQESRIADAPFDDQKADLVLRSSDGADFHVYRIILSLASPTFQSMFADHVFDPTPIVKMPEDAQTLDYILRCCYPIWMPGLTQLNDIRPVLYAAHKYNIDVVMKTLKISLEHCVEEDTLGVFAIAYRCGLYDVCDAAAKRFVQKPFISQHSPHLDQISARQYHRLLQYHRKCSADSTSSPPSWPSDPRVSESGETNPSPRNADAPFDNKFYKNADIILHSSDDVNFYLHKNILSMASSIFHDMFSLPQPSSVPVLDEGTGNVPVIDVTENGMTLELMLECCYPIRLPRFNQLHNIRSVLAAARKYDMVIATTHAENALRASLLADDRDVLGIFSVALQFEFYDICVMAAKLSIQDNQLSLDPTELDHIPALHYHMLAQYHHRCGEAASSVASARDWFFKGISTIISTNRCTRCQIRDPDGRSGWYAPMDLWQYLRRAKQALRTRPHHSTVSSKDTREQWDFTIFDCHYCGETLAREYFSQVFAKEVERVVNAIEVPKFCQG